MQKTSWLCAKLAGCSTTCKLRRRPCGSSPQWPRAIFSGRWPSWKKGILTLIYQDVLPDLPSERLLEAAVEEVLVLKPPLGTATHSKTSMLTSRSLDYFYLFRRFDLPSRCMYYDDKKRLLTLKAAGKEETQLNTSPLYSITLDPQVMIFLTIPLRAVHFCYVHGPTEFSIGGFLYLDGDLKPLALNQLSMTTADSAMIFKPCVELSDEARQDLDWYRMPLDSLHAAGCQQFAFVGPDKLLPGDVHSGLGGFAYTFQQDGRLKVLFFAISACGQLLQRGYLRRYAIMNTAVLDRDAPPAVIAQKLTRKPEWPLGHDQEVDVARMKVPLMHPLLLHALTITPCKAALRTRAASAITSAAVRESRLEATIEFGMNALSLFCVSWLTRTIGHDPPGATDEPDGWKRYICYLLIFCNWVKSLFMEVLLIVGHWKYGWLSDHVFEFHSTFTAAILVSTGTFVWYYHHHNFSLPNSHTSKVLCASVGCLMWFRFLWVIRTVERLNVGRRVLPILGSLMEATSFLLVTIFIFGASIQVSLAFTDEDLPTIMFDTYRMGFIGDMQSRLFIDYDDPVPLFTPLGLASHFAYMLFGFLVMVSMANIFIQVMGQAYADEFAVVEVSFNRARAFRGLQFFMYYELLQQLVGCCPPTAESKRKVTWFCYDRHCSWAT
eukprot:TRINITY_DN91100_c0_g1_i1.p1 TRINITY_DN91100_c0_g1~~TRINITY_DN91100_c0_g1_i1.p1  ORF type:complete len:664 (-),score=44.35 TRINITY_DN91100_c0_g1_i1:153-2144(-)